MLYQLTNVDYNDGNSTAYHYDDLGNRTSVVNGGTTSYNSNSLNQYTSVGGTGYSYDDNGNLTNDGTYLYYYDCENRLTEVNDINDCPVACYAYDYLGRRVSKTAGGTTTKYCYDGDQVIAEYEGGSLKRKFIYGPGIDEPVMMIDVAGETETTYYYHFDGLGSVAAVSDEAGGVLERYSYDVFGEPNRTSDVNNPYLFTGRRLDPETDNYYYRARYYAPKIGRFLQADPLGTMPDSGEINWFDPTTQYDAGMNLYAYVGNNPSNMVDPTGKVAYGNYCGSGSRGGAPIDDLDRACKNHDDCYDKCGVSGVKGVICPSICARKCDRKLCFGAGSSSCGLFDWKCNAAKRITMGIFCGNGIRIW